MGRHSGAHAPARSAFSPPSLLLALGVALLVTAVLLATVAIVKSGAQPQAAPNPTPSPSPLISMPSPTSAPTASPSPTPSPTINPTTVAGTPTLVLRFIGPSWVRIRDARGTVVLLGIQPAGAVRRFNGPRFDVELGSAGAVLVAIKGGPAHVTGRVGQISRFTVTGS